jgi:predicted Zn-dependent protease
MAHAPARAAPRAEIVSVLGTGEKRDDGQLPWTAAKANESVPPGGFVRTGALSQMSLILPDRTQVRLNQNSQLQIKTMADASQWSQSTLDLSAGRAWSHARPPSAPAGTVAPAARLRMDTPSATLSIRGTDWDVEVLPDGTTRLTVFSGEVALANTQGEIKIGPGETGLSESGKLPVKLLLAKPAERVQWVSAWRSQPRRWLGTRAGLWEAVISEMEKGRLSQAEGLIAQGASSLDQNLIQADLAMLMGDADRALGLLEPVAVGADVTAELLAFLMRTHLALGKPERAESVLARVPVRFVAHREIWLVKAELALFRGDAAAARQAIAGALTLDGRDAEAWLLLGRLEADRDNSRLARAALAMAQASDATRLPALAQLGQLETQSGALQLARQIHAEVLARSPDDYVALTSRGILKLKTGDGLGAIDDFLRAGVIEPSYARAWLYQGLAFYALGEAQRARQALVRASEIDALDPLPHQILGLLAADQGDTGAAVDAAQQAQRRLPYLRSLNPLLTNQKGSANLGSALADAGADAWANHYAIAAQTPWWAGSHLFAADRQPSGFNKTSGLLQGFLTDPTVFGVSSGQSALIPMPGHHGRIDFFTERASWRQNALIATANGLFAEPIPVAYFVSQDLSDGGAVGSADTARGHNQTLGLGLRPRPDLGLFGFGTRTAVTGRLRNDVLPDDPLAVNGSREDIGLNFKVDASNQIWLKAGSGRQSTLLTGSVTIPSMVTLHQFSSTVSQSEAQFRQVFSVGEGAWLSWGYEQAMQDKPALFDVQANPASRLVIDQVQRLQSRDAHLVAHLPLGRNVKLETGLFAQTTRSDDSSSLRVNGLNLTPPEESSRTFVNTHWRHGIQWQFDPQSSLSLVSQQWRRPTGNSSLAPTDTLGVPVNDQITGPGGLYRRTQLRLAREMTPSMFFQAILDDEQVQNLHSPMSSAVPNLEFTELENLQQRRDFFTFNQPLEGTPAFLEGSIRSLAMVFNGRLTAGQTIAVEYRRAQAFQTGVRAGLRIPYMADHSLRVTHQALLAPGWRMGLQGNWRDERFRDEANSADQRLEAGWTLGASLYWESPGKHWTAQALLDTLAAGRASSAEPDRKLLFRATRNF